MKFGKIERGFPQGSFIGDSAPSSVTLRTPDTLVSTPGMARAVAAPGHRACFGLQAYSDRWKL